MKIIFKGYVISGNRHISAGDDISTMTWGDGNYGKYKKR